MVALCGLIVLVLANSVLSSYPEDEEGSNNLFQSWKQEHGKEYKLLGEDFGRFQIFKDNLKLINKLNGMYKGRMEFAANKFADLDPKEFQSKILMPKRRAPTFESSRYIKSTVNDPLPDSFDWVPKNMVSSVKDQGAAGSCWAFSTVENIEGQWAMAGKPLTNLSVEQVVDCDGMEDIPGKNADCGVFGGWPYLAYQYIIKTGGLSTWSDYPYCSGDTADKHHPEDNCMPCPAPGFNASLCGPPVPYCNMSQSCVAKLDKSKLVNGLQLSSWNAIDQNETVVAEQLMKIGPLSIAINAELLQLYHKGVFEPHHCDPKNLDHAVLLVGFGKEKTLFGEKSFWKVKNSWGPKWGLNGYFQIKRDVGMCGINTQVTTAVLSQPNK
ncbi:procathepsin L-like [Mytilus trossulus]|uniref:procathepsin L-like n=1 Tax=Mytilus trossulus TaxID=6551 RepID=UPI003005DF6B